MKELPQMRARIPRKRYGLMGLFFMYELLGLGKVCEQ